MTRYFFRLLHIVLAILAGLDFLDLSRTLSIIGSAAFICILF